MNYQFAHPEFFMLLLVLPLMAWWYWKRWRQRLPGHRVPTLAGVSHGGWRSYGFHGLAALRMLAMGLLVVALARPQTLSSYEKVTSEGIDIVLTIDVSLSMLAEDFEPNRLEVAKEVATDFIQGRPNDRIGLVVFSGESFTQSPITSDKPVLLDLLQNVESGLLEDGTAIGMGLATAIDRLRESEAESKIIILLTDGENNAGIISPRLAAELAAEYGIRVYTIGIGSLGYVYMPDPNIPGRRHRIEVRIDEELLKEIADMTDGQYFRATDEQKLREIYQEIDQLERTEVEVAVTQRRTEEFRAFALFGALFFLLEIILRYTLLKIVP